MSNKPSNHLPIKWFRHASPYINLHRGKTFVVLISGEAVTHPSIDNLIHDIALLNSLGIRTVIVHGVRQQLESKLSSQSIASRFVGDLRITDSTTLELAIEANSLVRSTLEKLFSMGLPNSPMHGSRIRVSSCTAVTAKPAGIIDGVDLEHTGIVRKIDTNAIQHLLIAKHVVLLSPIGYSPVGEAFNLNAEQLACELAVALTADKLILLGEDDGIFDNTQQLIRELTWDGANQYLRSSLGDNNESILHLQAAANAVANGVPRVHLMSYKRDGALLQELFTVDGSGTLVTQMRFETIRSANIDDISAILELLKPLEEEGVLLRRSRELLESEIGNFYISERDGMIVAVAALYPFHTDATGEIACVATHPDFRSEKRGQRLIKHIEQQARHQGLHSVFVLTTSSGHWFIEQGYSPSELDALPIRKQVLYNYQRNSKALAKSLV